jgi:hypothetical protein
LQRELARVYRSSYCGTSPDVIAVAGPQRRETVAALRDAVRAARGNAVTDTAAAITYSAFTALPATVRLPASQSLSEELGSSPVIARIDRSSRRRRLGAQGTLTRAVADRRGSSRSIVGIVVAVWERPARCRR